MLAILPFDNLASTSAIDHDIAKFHRFRFSFAFAFRSRTAFPPPALPAKRSEAQKVAKNSSPKDTSTCLD